MIPRRTVWSMAIGCGLSVANLYYSQPLLVEMARSLGVPPPRMGLVATLPQVGYALGLLLFVPLGDLLERRSFITAKLAAVTLALLAVAASPSFAWLAVASLVLGATTVVPQVLIPFAAGLAAPEERGKVVGTVMSGLLVGVLSARTVSGFVGTHLGWRTMYLIAAALMVALAAALRLLLPRSSPAVTGISYPALLRSLGDLLRTEPVLRQSCLFGASGFGAFSAFWTTLAFYLAGPEHGHGGDVAGLFGLVGIVGALAAPVVGRSADRRSPRTTIALGLACMLLAFGVLYGLGGWIGGLVPGVILLDLGAQMNQVSNQARIYSLKAEAHSRLNTAFMVAFFLGGSLGSYAASWAWARLGWAGPGSAWSAARSWRSASPGSPRRRSPPPSPWPRRSDGASPPGEAAGLGSGLPVGHPEPGGGRATSHLDAGGRDEHDHRRSGRPVSGPAPHLDTRSLLVMAQHKGRIIKPETTYIDRVAINLDADTGPLANQGHLELPIGAAVQVGETYRMELADGRAGEIRITSYNDITNVAQFQVVGTLH